VHTTQSALLAQVRSCPFWEGRPRGALFTDATTRSHRKLSRPCVSGPARHPPTARTKCFESLVSIREKSRRLSKKKKSGRKRTRVEESRDAALRAKESGGPPKSHSKVLFLTWLLPIVTIVAVAFWARWMRESAQPVIVSNQFPMIGPKFVGSAGCATCHEREDTLWRGSHHQLAMQPAATSSVLGDFNNASFSNDGITSTFFRRNLKFMVRTDGADGALHDYEIKYTFGVYPLQQYLIAMPSGRLQALGIAWDSRPGERGGQRWFFLYPNQKIPPSNPLHWTSIDQTWNYMCADCHSTNVRKNYQLRTLTYATKYAEIDIGCEACHGPGSNHVS
jgi:hypothetical protein